MVPLCSSAIFDDSQPPVADITPPPEVPPPREADHNNTERYSPQPEIISSPDHDAQPQPQEAEIIPPPEVIPPRTTELDIEVEVFLSGGAPENTSSSDPQEYDELGKDKRVKFLSVRLKSYVTNAAFTTDSTSESTCLYPFANYVSTHRLSSSQQSFLAKIAEAVELKFFKDAVKYKEWCDAMGIEIDALKKNYTWDITDLPMGKVDIGCKWVFHIKFNSDGTMERFKARLVALGNQQKEGVDYK